MSKLSLPILFYVLIGCAPVTAAIQVTPSAVVLDNPEACQQLLVTLANGDGTRTARYEVKNPAIAGVDSSGLVTPKSEGQTEILIRIGQETARVQVEVRGSPF
jgi:hypothetical protein